MLKSVSNGQLLVAVKSNRIVGYFGIFGSLVLLAVSLYLQFYSVLSTIFFTLTISFLSLARPTFELYERALIKYAPIGPLKWVYKFRSIDQTKIKNNVLEIQHVKGVKRIRLFPAFYDKTSLNELKKILQNNKYRNRSR